MRIKPKMGGNINRSECDTTAGPLDINVNKDQAPQYEN